MKKTLAVLLAAAAIVLAGLSGAAAVSASSENAGQDSSVAVGWWPNFTQNSVSVDAVGWWPNSTPTDSGTN